MIEYKIEFPLFNARIALGTISLQTTVPPRHLILSRSKLLFHRDLKNHIINLNFILFSVYFDDLTGQVFSLFILTVAAAESAIGLAIIILYYRVRGKISINQQSILKN